MDDDARVKALLADGLSRPQIARRLGITYHAVRLSCDRLGVVRRGVGGRPPRDASNEQTNILDRCRDWATRAGLFFRTARGRHYIYDQPIAEFIDARAALSFLMNKARRGAALQRHRLNSAVSPPAGSRGDVTAAADIIGSASAVVIIRSPQLSGVCHG